jgi:hypothetical protein
MATVRERLQLRTRALKMLAQGWNPTRLAAKLRVSERSIYRWKLIAEQSDARGPLEK